MSLFVYAFRDKKSGVISNAFVLLLANNDH